jgi:hypothetical protein
MIKSLNQPRLYVTRGSAFKEKYSLLNDIIHLFFIKQCSLPATPRISLRRYYSRRCHALEKPPAVRPPGYHIQVMSILVVAIRPESSSVSHVLLLRPQ